jgi:hypothetical protein
MSARVRHKSRTASSSGLGMPTPTSSPARDRRGEPAAVPPVGLGPCHQVPEEQRRRDHLAAHAHAVQQPANSKPVGPAW